MTHERQIVPAGPGLPDGGLGYRPEWAVMRLFAISVQAKKPNEENSAYKVYTSAGWVLTDDVGDVTMRGLEIALEKWPVEGGWIEHQVVSCEVPPEIIEAVTR